MLSIHFTLVQVVNMLRALAERDPDRIGKSGDGGCVYATVQGHVLTPVCIVGQMFSDLGLLRLLLHNPSDLNYNDGFLGACAVEADFWSFIANYGITADLDAKEFMHSVQRKQDDGITWGEAFSMAVQEYRAEQMEALDRRLDNLFV